MSVSPPAAKKSKANEIIRVNGIDGRVKSVTVRLNGTVSQITLRNAFLLKKETPISLLSDNIVLDGDTDVFVLPSEWENLKFNLEWDNQQMSVNFEPKWQLKERWRLNALNWLYTIPPSKDCVIVLSSTTAATFHHGTHQAFVENSSSFNVAPVAQGENITVIVAKIIPSVDLVLLRATNGVFPISPRIEYPRLGMKFCVIGFDHFDQSNKTYSYGTIFTQTPHYYLNEQRAYMGPFWLGTARTSRGDSGGICISSNGYLIGMNVLTTCMPSTCHTNANSEAAIFVSKNVLVGAQTLVNERLLFEKPADPEPQSSFNTEEIIIRVYK